MQWKMQVGNLTTNMNVKIDFTLPGFRATKILTWYCHGLESARGIYNTILGRDLLISLGLKYYFSNTPLK